MFEFRKITATAVLVACLGAGVTQLPNMTGSAGAAGRSAHGSSEPAGRQSMSHLEAHTDLERTGHTTLAAHPTGLVFDKTFVSADRVGAAKSPGVSASVDLRQWAMPIGDQKTLFSCTTWAIDYAMLGWYANREGVSGAPFAPMYTYSQINHGVDAGSQPVDALNLAMTQGTDTHADYAQGDYDWQTQPTAAERANAANYKISGYETLFSGTAGQGTAADNALENALSAGKPVAIAMEARQGFEHLTAGTVDQDNTSAIAGGHAVPRGRLRLAGPAHPELVEHDLGRRGLRPHRMERGRHRRLRRLHDQRSRHLHEQQHEQHHAHGGHGWRERCGRSRLPRDRNGSGERELVGNGQRLPLHRVDFDQRRRLGRRGPAGSPPRPRPRLHSASSPATPTASRSRRTTPPATAATTATRRLSSRRSSTTPAQRPRPDGAVTTGLPRSVARA